MNPTYIAIDLKRQFRDISNIMFTFAMPALMYVIFGATSGVGDYPAGHANVKFYIMSSMAAYGATTAAVAMSGTAATEALLGWGRQISLTRQPAIGFVVNKIAVALSVAAVAAGFVFGIGALTGASAPASVWVATYLIALFGATVFAAYGLAAGLLFRSETAVGIASAGVVFFAFFGNLFMPLSGTMLDVARFTPMYGYAGLVRWPALEGAVIQVDPPQTDSIWMLLANVAVWTTVFVALAVLGMRQARTRR